MKRAPFIAGLFAAVAASATVTWRWTVPAPVTMGDVLAVGMCGAWHVAGSGELSWPESLGVDCGSTPAPPASAAQRCAYVEWAWANLEHTLAVLRSIGEESGLAEALAVGTDLRAVVAAVRMQECMLEPGGGDLI